MINLCIGLVLLVIGALIIIGGLQRIAAVAERIVPFMAVAYVILGIIFVAVNYDMIIPAFASIFKFAFGVKAVEDGRVAKLVLGNTQIQIGKDEDGNGIDDDFEAETEVDDFKEDPYPEE